MFKKVLIANRGEIAVRVIRTCREMGIRTVALFEASDKDSLHVRLADECVQLDSPAAFFDIGRIIQIAAETAADALHPGYGFLAERAEFIRACEEAGIVFIGPPSEVAARTEDKIRTLVRVSEGGYPTVAHSGRSFGEDEFDALEKEAAALGFPLVVKSGRGGRGRGERLVARPEKLAESARRAQVEAQAVYGNRQLYLEQAIIPAHQVGVQIIGDRNGRIIHLGEREGSVLAGNQKLIEESPAPCLTPQARRQLWETAVHIARLLDYQNVGTVEFLVDEDGRFYFSEIKARLQVEHSLSEMVSGLDLVREQIRMAAGEAEVEQESVALNGWAMMARIWAESPWDGYLPGSGRAVQVRFPGGPGIRVDSHLASGAEVSAAYDPLIAKVTAWAGQRKDCLRRLRGAIEEYRLVNVCSNLPLLLQVLQAEAFVQGSINTEWRRRPVPAQGPSDEERISPQVVRDLAVAAAVLYVRRNQQMMRPEMPERFVSGWHRNSRQF